MKARGEHFIWRAWLAKWAGDLPTPFDIFAHGMILGLIIGATLGTVITILVRP